MSDLNLNTPSPDVTSNKGVDITLNNFSSEIVEASQKQLVIVEFWSPQSSASKQLTPLLETVVVSTQGATKLAKINVAKHPQIAQQMHVKSIPAVYAFWQGQPVDGFMGTIPEQQLNNWITKLIQTTGVKTTEEASKGIGRAIKQAENLLEKGDITTAQSIFEDLASEFPEEPEVLSGCIKCMIKLKKFDDAKNLLKALPAKLANNTKLLSIKAALELAEQSSSKTGSSERWEKELEQNPNNHDIRFDLAMHLYGKGETKEALNHLLEIIRRDRKWNDDGARLQTLKIFEALGPTHEYTIEARKKLSTILFS